MNMDQAAGAEEIPAAAQFPGLLACWFCSQHIEGEFTTIQNTAGIGPFWQSVRGLYPLKPGITSTSQLCLRENCIATAYRDFTLWKTRKKSRRTSLPFITWREAERPWNKDLAVPLVAAARGGLRDSDPMPTGSAANASSELPAGEDAGYDGARAHSEQVPKMSVDYLVNFLEAADAIPAESAPLFSAIIEANFQLKNTLRDLEAVIDKLRKADPQHKAALLKHLQELLATVNEAQSQKLSMAEDAHECIARSFGRLDSDRAQMEAGGAEVEDAPEDDNAPASPIPAKRAERKPAVASEERGAKRPRPVKEVVRRPARPAVKKPAKEALRYCVANCKVQLGEMVGCDNTACEFGQWFHPECVGMRAAPTSKTWFCPQCRPDAARLSKTS